MDWKEKLAKSQELFATAKGILVNAEASAEEKEKVKLILEDAKAMKAEGVQLKEIELSALELDVMVEQVQQEAKVAGRVRENVGTEFKTFGEMLTAIQGWAKLGIKDDRLHWYSDKDGKVEATKDLIEAVGASGGFLVPTEFIEELYAVMAEDNFVRQRATIIPMRRRQVNIPVLDQTGTTANVPHWFGGMTFYWAEEATEKTESDPAFRQIEMVAHKLIGYTRAADELVEDAAISLDALLSGELGFVGGARWHEEYAFLNGTGAGMPLGVIPAPATITVARAADGAIGFADLANMMENFLPTGQGVWIITQSAMADLIQLNGPAGNPSYIWQPNARDGVPGYLLGYPVIWCEKVPRIGTTGDVVLADWRYYLIGDRKAITVESTQFDRWRYDETSWRMVHRVDGQPWLSAPLTYQDGTTQVSPFVILGDKSS
jgi:HK97 family phage major capsid protein